MVDSSNQTVFLDYKEIKALKTASWCLAQRFLTKAEHEAREEAISGFHSLLGG
jgi:hypothetical protein